jgi:hypothetical protein
MGSSRTNTAMPSFVATMFCTFRQSLQRKNRKETVVVGYSVFIISLAKQTIAVQEKGMANGPEHATPKRASQDHTKRLQHRYTTTTTIAISS